MIVNIEIVLVTLKVDAELEWLLRYSWKMTQLITLR